MPSLTDRLRELGVQIGTGEIQPEQKKVPGRLDLLEALPGSWEATSSGECFVVRKEISPATQHGRRDLSIPQPIEVFESSDSLKGISQVPLSEYLFIDTETTGLSGGVGTYVFLIGAAKFVGDEIHLAQFFLQDPGLESAQLAALESFSASSSIVISYNGKSFDLPRIKTRYRYHGWPDPFPGIKHLDLLHVARRLWKNHLPGCSLGDLEHHLLHLTRSELDIPGWKVADYYFSYLQEGDPAPLESIFYHNEIDVLSLIALLGYTTERLGSPLDNSEPAQDDIVSIAKYLAFLGHSRQATEVLEGAISTGVLPEDQQIEGSAFLASLYKKAGILEKALPLWIKTANRGSIDCKIELAKYYEHSELDISEALHWTLSALEESRADLSRYQEKIIPQLDHRLKRLKKKAKR